MAEFSINNVSKSKLTDDGISVEELLELLNEEDELNKSLLDSLNIENLKKDFISISGAKQLVTLQKGINKRFHKEDFISPLNDIAVYCEDNKLTFSFVNLNESEYLSQLNLSSVDAIPKYSSKNDFFSWLYGMDKYANELIKNGLDDILSHNLDLLRQQEIGTKKRRYRILQDLNNKQFYVRAIISLDRYNNYDNNITIVIALLSLHRKMQELGIVYSLNRVEYNESYIRIFFEEEGKKELKGLGYVKNIIEVSNDEVKREALKFDAISNIEFIDSENNTQELMIQSSFSNRPKVKTNILAIAHSLSPKKFVEKLEEIDNSVKIHEELFNLINEISQISNPLQIMFLIKQMVKNARDESFKKHKNKVQKIIDTHVVDNMIQLLSLFKKIELVTENDIEASEYVRYIIYETLIERKANR
ncbi:MAG: hypothetical protein KH100_09825 [Dysgonomonas mossii]|uniref:hypothetical protein n=1 Tax=Dysgonomonas TaxID=156973 RepID=UPI001E09C7E0|nr:MULTISPECIES: hypothetical protein [Dysgonomonas]MBS5797603.1 hypothetical protein [Dysgonomonas mossii]MBS7111482.1 hypothetical protein [Dysgonomonas mossii]